jgi:aspartate/methionine/tyrosine aminotransferase
MDVLAQANALEAQGRRILHLETGQPGTPAPAPARAAAAHALESDLLGYTEALGRPALQQAIAKRYRDVYGLDLDPNRVIVTTGSSAGFILSFLALFEGGDALAMTVPGYPAYRHTAQALSLRPVPVESGYAQGFQPSVAALARVEGAKGLLLASPNNPTGTIIAPNTLRALCDLARDKGWSLISDEIYHGIAFDAPAETALRFDDRAIVVNSFSKYFSMTGWRIGWMVVPEALIRPIERLAQNLYISAPTISQRAAMGALEALPELDGHVARYKRNRDRLMGALRNGGLAHVAPADGAFYLYANVAATGMSSPELAKRLLQDAGVGVTPGLDFDPAGGGEWIRLSFAGAENTIAEAAEIIENWLRRRV